MKKIITLLLLSVLIAACSERHLCPTYGSNYNAKETQRTINHQANHKH